MWRSKVKRAWAVDEDGVVVILNEPEHHDGAHRPREQRSEAGAHDAQAETVDGDRIAGDVDDVHQCRGEKRDARVAHRTIERRAGVIDRQKGIGEQRQEEVGLRIFHDAPFHVAEHEVQNRPAAKQRNRGDEKRGEQGHV